MKIMNKLIRILLTLIVFFIFAPFFLVSDYSLKDVIVGIYGKME